MPFYSYVCKGCGHGFETLVRGDETPACPSCASTELERQMSMVTAPGKSGEIIKSARARAAREGHFSNYKRSEIPRR